MLFAKSGYRRSHRQNDLAILFDPMQRMSLVNNQERNMKIAVDIIFLIVFACSTVTYGDQCSIPPDKILVVRHAEKGDFTYDSPLSIQGWKRAVALLDAIGNEELSAIYTTQMIRTKHTALPLSIYKDIQPNEVHKDQIGELCHVLCAEHKKETVLVVGHSDTIPELFSCLGITKTVYPEYGDLFIVTFPSGGAAFKKSHFGE